MGEKPSAPPEEDHQVLGKMSSSTPMLEEKLPRILIREDTVLAGLKGCAGCGGAHFTCAGVTQQWSSLCWGKKSEKKYYCLLVSLSATFVLSLIGTVFFCFTNTLNNAILSSMVIRNNSMAFSLWRSPTVQPLMKVHLFNYTNWEQVRDGNERKLHVEDVGPFVYSFLRKKSCRLGSHYGNDSRGTEEAAGEVYGQRSSCYWIFMQKVERVNIKFEDDWLSYQERNVFRYRPDKTKGVQFDKVVVPNLPLMGVVSKAIQMNLGSFAHSAMNAALFAFANHKDAFVKLPVHSFLWGYDDTIINTAKPFLSIQGQLKFTNFGLLATKNGTVDEHFTINTGDVDKDRMNVIEKLNGDNHLTYWSNPECNSLEATDGSIFPPSILDRKKTLYVFFPQLCRRLPFIYEKDVVTADGIQLLRYRMPIDVFDDYKHNPANQCYCEMDGTCPPRGVINVTACAMGAPALASHPHFYLGDPELRQNVTGLNPDPALHDSYLDVHPTLGISLHGKSSMQINIQVKKTSSFPALSFLEEGTILPIAWIEMTVEEIPESIRSLIYHGTFSTAAAQLALTVICIIAFTVSSVCLSILVFQRRRRPCVTLKKVVLTEAELKGLKAAS